MKTLKTIKKLLQFMKKKRIFTTAELKEKTGIHIVDAYTNVEEYLQQLEAYGVIRKTGESGAMWEYVGFKDERIENREEAKDRKEKHKAVEHVKELLNWIEDRLSKRPAVNPHCMDSGDHYDAGILDGIAIVGYALQRILDGEDIEKIKKDFYDDRYRISNEKKDKMAKHVKELLK